MPAPLTEFTRAPHAGVEVPKADVLEVERQAKRKPRAGRQEGK